MTRKTNARILKRSRTLFCIARVSPSLPVCTSRTCISGGGSDCLFGCATLFGRGPHLGKLHARSRRHTAEAGGPIRDRFFCLGARGRGGTEGRGAGVWSGGDGRRTGGDAGGRRLERLEDMAETAAGGRWQGRQTYKTSGTRTASKEQRHAAISLSLHANCPEGQARRNTASLAVLLHNGQLLTGERLRPRRWRRCGGRDNGTHNGRRGHPRGRFLSARLLGGGLGRWWYIMGAAET